ncbi:MAG: acetylglutamate kinase [Lutibacter sp.]
MGKQPLHIVKIGGNIIEDSLLLKSFLKDFSAIEEPKILVHGGGKSATKLANKLNLTPEMIEGRRITDQPNLEIAVMIYAGLTNKTIVAQLQANSSNAAGFTGADANLILSEKRPVKEIDFGFVGDVVCVNAKEIKMFIESGIVPVFCAITHDKNGQLLNTNADTIASEIAIAMANFYEVTLNYVFELKGVLSSITDENSVIQHINLEKYEQLVGEGIISEGMIPKLHNCFNALKKGVSKVKIGDTKMIGNITNSHTTLSLK